jgi:RimJ/RimL family protein N-acetyltransferase
VFGGEFIVLTSPNSSILVENVVIREATPEDARGVIAAVQSIRAEPDQDLMGTLEVFDLTEDEEHALIKAITANPNALMLVAEVISTGQVVGALTCQHRLHVSRWHVVQLGVMVCAAWREMDISARLLQEAIRWAQRHEVIRRMEVEVLAHDTEILALYTRLGFRIEGRGIEAVRKGDDYLDCYWMALPVVEKAS